MGAADKEFAKEAADALVEELTTDIGVPERVHYAAGVLLDAEDFGAEQRYARGRLARALAALHGHGTVAGLKVTLAADPERRKKAHLEVAPGLALDRYGRLIELRRSQCLDAAGWLAQKAAQPEEKRQAVLDALDPAGTGLALAVQIRFAVCRHGVTPAFAAGPFNATDYVVPSRLADAFELVLVPRPLAAPAAAGAPFRDFAALLAAPPASEAELHAALVNLAIEDSPFPKTANARGDTLPWVLLAHVNLPVRETL
ncbi:MAG TPA: hypothetical protein VF104_02670, partial [Burkholderiales bacterium]